MVKKTKKHSPTTPSKHSSKTTAISRAIQSKQDTHNFLEESWKATTILAILLAIALIIPVLFVLYKGNQISPIIGNVITSLEGYFTGLALVAPLVSIVTIPLWKHAQRKSAIIISLVLVSILVLTYLNLPAQVTGNPSPPTPPRWHSVTKWKAPYCNDQQNWAVFKKTTNYICSTHELTMWQEQHVKNYLSYAETDLISVKGKLSYNQRTFQFSAHVTFDNPADGDTQAAIIVQTPPNSSGGFALALNADGKCEVQRFGNLRDPTLISCQRVQGGSSFKISMMVVNQALYCSINGVPVVAVSDNLQSGMIGLMVQLQGASQSSSKVEFSDIELDE